MQSPEPEAHDKVLDNSRSNWDLKMLVFEERGKPEDPEKKPLGKTMFEDFISLALYP